MQGLMLFIVTRAANVQVEGRAMLQETTSFDSWRRARGMGLNAFINIRLISRSVMSDVPKYASTRPSVDLDILRWRHSNRLISGGLFCSYLAIRSGHCKEELQSKKMGMYVQCDPNTEP